MNPAVRKLPFELWVNTFLTAVEYHHSLCRSQEIINYLLQESSVAFYCIDIGLVVFQ